MNAEPVNINYSLLLLSKYSHLVDDILDLETDKKEGKLTIPIIKGVSHARKLALKLKEKALFIFENDLKFLSKQPSRQSLETLIHFVLERDY